MSEAFDPFRDLDLIAASMLITEGRLRIISGWSVAYATAFVNGSSEILSLLFRAYNHPSWLEFASETDRLDLVAVTTELNSAAHIYVSAAEASVPIVGQMQEEVSIRKAAKAQGKCRGDLLQAVCNTLSVLQEILEFWGLAGEDDLQVLLERFVHEQVPQRLRHRRRIAGRMRALIIDGYNTARSMHFALEQMYKRATDEDTRAPLREARAFVAEIRQRSFACITPIDIFCYVVDQDPYLRRRVAFAPTVEEAARSAAGHIDRAKYVWSNVDYLISYERSRHWPNVDQLLALPVGENR